MSPGSVCLRPVPVALAAKNSGLPLWSCPCPCEELFCLRPNWSETSGKEVCTFGKEYVDCIWEALDLHRVRVGTPGVDRGDTGPQIAK